MTWLPDNFLPRQFLRGLSPPVFTEAVRSLAWTRAGHLLVVTDHQVTEFPSGRSRRLRVFSKWTPDPFMGRSPGILLNASGTQGIGPGFVLNLTTLKSHPLSNKAIWMGDRLISIGSPGSGQFNLRNRAIAKGWFVLGLSPWLDLALACRKEPADGDTTYLLRLNPVSGHSTVLAAYPNTSDDHNWLCSVQEHGRGEILVHSLNLASDFTQPYFAGKKLRPVLRPVPKSWIRTTLSVEWISPNSSWMVVRQKLMREDRQRGFWIDTMDLWNPRLKKTFRLAKATMTSKTAVTLFQGQSLGPASVDPTRHRIAYTVVSDGVSRVIIDRLPGLSR